MLEISSSSSIEEVLEEASSLNKKYSTYNDDELAALENDKLSATFELNKIITGLFSPQIETFEPWAAHVDASRTNMSAKQLLQLVISKNCESPYVLNKNYVSLTEINSPFVEYAKEDGVILYTNFNFLIIYYTETNTLYTSYCPPIKRMTNNTITLRYKLDMYVNKRISKGEMLYDYTGQTIDTHVPKVGYRFKILYGSFYGYTADDAFVMSESAARRAKIYYSKKLFIPISKELKYLKNHNDNYLHEMGEITTENYLDYFKVDGSESILSEFNNISNKQSKIYGKAVESINGAEVVTLKVHRITKETFDLLDKEYLYNPGLIKEVKFQYEKQLVIKQDMFSKLNTVFKNDAAVSYTNNLFSQYESADVFPKTKLEDIAADYKIDKDNIDYVIEVEIYKEEETSRGDKFANVFAGKGVCSLILPDHLMPNQCDIIFNPLGLFGRNNWGTIFEIGIAKVIRDVESTIDDKLATINKINTINELFIKEFDIEYYEDILYILNMIDSDETYWKSFHQSVVDDGFYIFVSNFPKISFYKYTISFLKPYQEKYNINIIEKDEVVYSKDLMQFMRDRGYVSNVFDESIVEEVRQQSYIGYNYWIKLFHTAYSKYNAISFANSYSKSTGEPPRGRNNGGGGHISWQTLAALIGHKEGNAISKELRTIKSDAIYDKNNFNRKFIADGEYTMKGRYKSPTVRTLNNSLALLCLRFTDINDETHESFNEINPETIENSIDISELLSGNSSDYTRTDNKDVAEDE